jgi:hypothetical protein
MFGVNHVYNADYNTFMIFFFYVFQFLDTCVYNMNISAPANINELTYALLKHNKLYYLPTGKKEEKKKKERRSNIKHNDDKSVMTKSKHLFECIQTLINYDGSKPKFINV